MTLLAAARDVIDAKHASFKKKPEAELLQNMSREAHYQATKAMETLRSDVASAERRAVFTLLHRQMKEKTDRAKGSAKKLEGLRELTRY